MAQALRRHGIDVLTSSEAGLLSAADVDYLAFGNSSGRVVVTNDPDFVALNQRQVPHAGIVFSDQRARSVGQLVTHLVLMYEVLEPADMVMRIEFA